MLEKAHVYVQTSQQYHVRLSATAKPILYEYFLHDFSYKYLYLYQLH